MAKAVTLIEAGELIFSKNRLVLTAHISPDGDGLGSALGLAHHLKERGKTVEVVFDDRLPLSLRFLPGYETIKNLATLEKISPKTGDDAPELLVVLDTDMSRIGRVREYAPDCPVLNIDHHRTNDEKADFLYSDYRAPAVAELIFTLLEEMPAEKTARFLSQETATCLYTGLATDTGFFRFSNTHPSTFRAAAKLLEAGVEPHVVSETLEAKPLARQESLAAAIQTLEMAADGKVGGLFLPYELMQKTESTEGFIDFVRVIDTVAIAVLVKAVKPDECRVSLRSKGLNVAEIAGKFGGGGHGRAAGCTVYAPLAEAKRLLLAACTELANSAGEMTR